MFFRSSNEIIVDSNSDNSFNAYGCSPKSITPESVGHSSMNVTPNAEDEANVFNESIEKPLRKRRRLYSSDEMLMQNDGNAQFL